MAQWGNWTAGTGFTTPYFNELFSTGTTWDSAKWRTAFKDVDASADSAATIVDGKGRLSIKSLTAFTTAIIRKETQNQVFDFSAGEKTLEFEIQDYNPEPDQSSGSTIHICPTIPTGDYAILESNFLRFAVGYTESNRFIRLQKKVNGTLSTIHEENIADNGGALTKYRIVVANANNVSIQRWNGSSWSTLANVTDAGLTFNNGYIMIEKYTQNTSALQTVDVDNIKVI